MHILEQCAWTVCGGINTSCCFRETAVRQRRTAAIWLFFRSTSGRRDRICAGDEKSLADNLLQKTAKTARLAMRRPAPSAGSLSQKRGKPCSGSEPAPYARRATEWESGDGCASGGGTGGDAAGS